MHIYHFTIFLQASFDPVCLYYAASTFKGWWQDWPAANSQSFCDSGQPVSAFLASVEVFPLTLLAPLGMPDGRTSSSHSSASTCMLHAISLTQWANHYISARVLYYLYLAWFPVFWAVDSSPINLARNQSFCNWGTLFVQTNSLLAMWSAHRLARNLRCKKLARIDGYPYYY